MWSEEDRYLQQRAPQAAPAPVARETPFHRQIISSLSAIRTNPKSFIPALKQWLIDFNGGWVLKQRTWAAPVNRIPRDIQDGIDWLVQ